MNEDKRQDIAAIRAFAVWAAVILGVMAFFVVTGASAEVVYSRLYDNQMFPGVRVLGVRLDGLSKDEARQAVQKAIDQALANGLPFRFRDQDVHIDATTPASGPDAARDLVLYNIDDAIDRAYAIGRSHGWRANVFEQLGVRLRPVDVPSQVTLDKDGIQLALRQALKGQLVEPSDASLDIKMGENGVPMVGIRNEQSGVRFLTDKSIATLQAQAQQLSFQEIPLQDELVQPQLRRTDLEPLVPKVEAMLRQPLIHLTYNSESSVVSMSDIASWITVTTASGSPSVAFDPNTFLTTVRSLNPNIEQQEKNGSLQVTDGKIVAFESGADGIAIDATSTLAEIATQWPATTTFPIITMVTPGSLIGDDPERLGIKEIIGVGTSNFGNSPVNRRKNIALGVQRVNGTIISPGEEFSLLKTLGTIDAQHGWLPELVIKGDKTEPDVGGGLCQIGTTTFRAALNTGLHITERRNHSYRVSYYEPAGTDATIFDPAPDFRFVNDTAHSILINAYIKGTNVIFEFWGTKDGRKVDPITPRIFNITPPPPMKLVETLDLPPGQKKCTEIAHAGADAEFTYGITYADGTKHSEVFSSHYRPWQAVCMIGVDKLSNPDATTTSMTP